MDPLEAPGVAIDVDALLDLRHGITAESVPAASNTVLPGGFVSRRRGRGLETADIRVFAEGDDIRHIDRNATARTGVPHVRTFQDERDRTALLLADFRAAMHWGTRRALRSVAAAEALAVIGWDVVFGGGRVGLMAFGGPSPVFVPARGRERGMIAVIGAAAAAHRTSLHAVAEGAETETEPLDRVLDMAREIAPRGASVYLATSFDDPGDDFDRAALSLIHRCDLEILLIRDAFETAPVSGAYPFETEDGRRGLARIAKEETASADMAVSRLQSLGVRTKVIDAAVDPADWRHGSGRH